MEGPNTTELFTLGNWLLSQAKWNNDLLTLLQQIPYARLHISLKDAKGFYCMASEVKTKLLFKHRHRSY